METWTYDKPTGTYKSHTMSSKLRFAAVAAAKFLPHVRPEQGFGKGKGEDVTITRIRAIAEPTNGRISEVQKIPLNAMTINTTSIKVTEWGSGVQYGNLWAALSKFDMKNAVQKTLRDQKMLTMDTAVAASFKTAKIKAIPTSLSAITFDTDGTPSTQALANLTFEHMGVIRDYMQDTIHCPFYREDHYVGLLSTKAARGIKNDPNFQKMREYLNPGDLIYKSEIGMVENIRIAEINHTNALSKSKGLGSVLGEAVIFGDDAVAMAEAETPELRMALPAEFGRAQSIAWYGVLEFGVVWDTANDGEARIIHITSL